MIFMSPVSLGGRGVLVSVEVAVLVAVPTLVSVAVLVDVGDGVNVVVLVGTIIGVAYEQVGEWVLKTRSHR